MLRGLTLTPSGFLGAWSIVDADDLAVVDSAEESVLRGELIVAFNEDWSLGQVGPDMVVVDRATKTEVARFPVVDPGLFKVEVAPSGTRIADVASHRIAITEFDTWQSEILDFESSFGRVRGVGFSADERFLAIGGEALYIVDIDAGSIVQSFPISGVSDVYWLDDTNLLIGTSTGVFAMVSRDLDQLGDIAAASLTRSYTAEECSTFGIDPCPTLEEILSR